MKTKKRFLSILLSLALVLGLMPGMGLTALAYDNNPYASLVNTTNVITFDNKAWYLIEDNSTAADAGTVTLLAKECVDASAFGSNNTYSGSTVETFVNNWYTNDNNISADAKTAVSGSGMFLLTTAQANAIAQSQNGANVLKCSRATGAGYNYWWLCSPGGKDDVAAIVLGDSGDVYGYGAFLYYTLGVRPALKLDLSKVTFDSATNTFSMAGSTTPAVTISPSADAGTVKVEEATLYHSYPDYWVLTATAAEGYRFLKWTFTSDGSAGQKFENPYNLPKDTIDQITGLTAVFEADKESAIPATVTANNRTYDGTENPLVTVNGEPTGGTMQYAVGSDATTEPTEGWSTSIPKATNVGTYYVWYKAVGDETHSDSEAAFVAVTINEEILVKYDSNGGSGTMKDQKVEKNVTTALNTNVFTRDGHSFKEWNTKADGSGDSYKDKAEIKLDASLTLYAQWKEIEKHTHHLEKVEAVDPGCETEGNKEYYRCTDESCDKWFEDQTAISEITDKSSVIIKATGHKWDNGEITKEATYDEEGIKTYTCENDPSHTKEETIPKKTRSNSNESNSSSVSKETGSSSDDSSDDSSGGSGGSGSKTGSVSTKSIDLSGKTIMTQTDSGAPVSDRGGNWGSDNLSWTYTKSDGNLAKSEWLNLEYNGHTYWYYFGDSSIMQTDWFNYNGATYYFIPEMDGWRGRMATGWQMIGDKWYYFEPALGATQGQMYRGAMTPDGHTVGADGAWDGNGTAPVGVIHTVTAVTGS